MPESDLFDFTPKCPRWFAGRLIRRRLLSQYFVEHLAPNLAICVAAPKKFAGVARMARPGHCPNRAAASSAHKRRSSATLNDLWLEAQERSAITLVDRLDGDRVAFALGLVHRGELLGRGAFGAGRGAHLGAVRRTLDDGDRLLTPGHARKKIGLVVGAEPKQLIFVAAGAGLLDRGRLYLFRIVVEGPRAIVPFCVEYHIWHRRAGANCRRLRASRIKIPLAPE